MRMRDLIRPRARRIAAAWPRVAALGALGALVALVAVSSPLRAISAQDPVRLPSVSIKEKPTPPGPKLLVGVVKDTSNFSIDGVEITIPSLQKLTYSKGDGSFRFENIPRGTDSVRARKIGYAAQVRSFKVEEQGGVGEFSLLPLARALPTVTTTAVRRGLSGTIGDTAFRAIGGAEVAVLGKNMFATTDSVGGFFLPVPPGGYMLSIKRAGYADKVTSVTIPPDSGRRMTAFLSPRHPTEVRQAWNIADLQSRRTWSDPLKQPMYTREDIQKHEIIWIWDLVSMAARTRVDPDCAVVVNGGPALAELSTLTVDDVESVEVLAGGGGLFRPITLPLRPKKGPPPKAKVPRIDVKASMAGNTREMIIANFQKACVQVFVWLR